MHDRRKFLKRFLAGGVALGLGSVTDAKTHVRPSSFPASFNDSELPGDYWKRTIFCQCGDPGILAAIGIEAWRIGCDIWHGEPFSEDIINMPYFVGVVDRKTLDRKQWAEYLEWRKILEDTTPCILVDGFGDGEGWPIDEYMEIRDPICQINVRGILYRVKDAHLAAQDWRPSVVSSWRSLETRWAFYRTYM